VRDDVDRLRRRIDDLIDDLEAEDITIQVLRQGPWTKHMLEQLWSSVDHLSGIQALFEVTAENQNQMVLFSQVRARSGLSPRQQANEHARMSRISTELFGRQTWPIENRQGSKQESGIAEMQYRMGATVAGWWRDLV
jgi:predicted TIM-barrel fold metal-dependent hydrolase